MTHCHGYKWEVQYDPHMGRPVSETPPELVRDNLTQQVVRPSTWSDHDATIDWCRKTMTPVVERQMWPQFNPPSAETVAAKLTYIRDELAHEQDVVWAEWVKGARKVQVVIVCCPGGMDCPTGR